MFVAIQQKILFIIYSNLPSAIRPVQHSDYLSAVPISPNVIK